MDHDEGLTGEESKAERVRRVYGAMDRILREDDYFHNRCVVSLGSTSHLAE